MSSHVIEIALLEGRVLTKGKALPKTARDRNGRRRGGAMLRPPRGGWIMTPEVRSWMRAHVGGGAKSRLEFDRGHGAYCYYDRSFHGIMIFVFRDAEVAMLFKLTWYGV